MFCTVVYQSFSLESLLRFLPIIFFFKSFYRETRSECLIQFLPIASPVTCKCKTMVSKACAYCYVTLSRGYSVCGICRKRVYCSRQCQVSDWKTGHKRWCSQSGEKDCDYSIRPSSGKGLGVFAMRDFKAGEKIIVERPIIKFKTEEFLQRSLNDIPASARDAVAALAPSDDGASLHDKIARNMIVCTDESDNERITGLFINLSRVNNCCIGNCDHGYLKEFGVKILVANHDLCEGEEVTFSYAQSYEEAIFPSRHARIQAVWKFDCRCLACSDRDAAEKLNRVAELDGEIFRLASLGMAEIALQKGRALVRIYADLRLSPKMYQRTYYDMFQAAIVHRRTSQQGAGLARQAAFYAALFYGADNETVRKYEALADNPSSHRNYHCLIY